jgi:assimilatory nitrate reductase catalytic subunit
MILPWQADDSLRSGQAFIAMHWGSEFVTGGVNLLTSKAVDPVSRQPELKHSALAVQRAELPWQAVLVGWFDAGQAQTLRTELLSAAASFAFASCVPFGRDRHGLMLRLADAAAPDPERCDAFLTAFGLDDARVLRYDDPVRHHARRLRLSGQHLQSMALLGSTVGQDWLISWLKDEVALELPPLTLLRPSDKAPSGMRPAGRTICNCFGVSERALEKSATTCAAGTPLLAHWQRELQCGTSCGSCLPELRQLAARRATPPAVSGEAPAAAAIS